MHNSGEHTPLLKRSGRSRIPSTSGKATKVVRVSPEIEKGNNFAYYDEDDDGGEKHDRRGLFSRFMNKTQRNTRRAFRKTGKELAAAAAAVTTTASSSALPGSNSHNDFEEYEEDDYNDMPWRCSFGTHENDGVWLNSSDRAGTIMAVLVWVLLLYSTFTVFLVVSAQKPVVAGAYATVATLALASHAKTTFTDPGAVPRQALPVNATMNTTYLMCNFCKTFKPSCAHHCRICNRCISGMDHHCPWMNNCVGNGNFKHFLLFLCYSWICSVMTITIFAIHYFFCDIIHNNNCNAFTVVEKQLVRVMTLVAWASLPFLTVMLNNAFTKIITGVGTIDRFQQKKKGTWNYHKYQNHPWKLQDFFGIGPVYLWPFPVDPTFEDYDRTMGYTTRQRLLREASCCELSPTSQASFDFDHLPTAAAATKVLEPSTKSATDPLQTA